MTLAKNTYIERVVIVFNEDGTLKGAHQTGIETIKDDGSIVSERSLPATPVDGQTLAQVLPDAADLTAQISALTTERDSLKIDIENGVVQEQPTTQSLAKLTLINRLNTAGLFDIALTALKSDTLQYERWQASYHVDPDNADIIALLTAIGGDVDALLAL